MKLNNSTKKVRITNPRNVFKEKPVKKAKQVTII